MKTLLFRELFPELNDNQIKLLKRYLKELVESCEHEDDQLDLLRAKIEDL